ncbi:MAG TPA: transglutaminase domain-containing protein [Candidatus Limnocylindria bacterium]|nr:transglutaminase domain-containing protein [Candidatus Limnocylindria bacterium]
MTAATATASAGVSAAARRMPFRPVEGWLTLFATALMVLAFAGSLVDARWTPTSAGPPEFLFWVGLVGLAMGMLGAKIGWGRWRTHLVGALFAGVFLPLIVGGIVLQTRLGAEVGWDPQGLAQRLAASDEVARRVWTDLAELRRPFTTEAAHYHLVFGALVWGGGLLAGFTVFGHRRPLDAVVVLGLALLANMALTSRNPGTQLNLLVLFSAGALLLLIRTHVFEEEVTWTRRRIGDPAAVGQLYLRGGAAFVTAAILGSVLLTTTASSAPLQGLWQDLPSKLQFVSEFFQKIAPPGAFRSAGGISFGGNAVTSGQWTPSDKTAFRAQLLPSEDRMFKWRAGAYSIYNGFGWEWGTTTDAPAAARDPVLAGQGDEPSTVGRRPLTALVIPDAFRDPIILGPNEIQSVDRPTVGKVVGADGWLSRIESTESLSTYNISALVPVLQDVQGGLTQARLRAAGTDYPAEIRTIYAQQLPDNALGPNATALLDTIVGLVEVPEGADANNPYDLARTMESYLSKNFEYDVDVREARDTQCAGVSSVECFATIKRGYCEYYASTMAVLLRARGVPARIAYGFLRGDRGPDGREVVEGRAAHWWVEVYFPESGWVEFDPTGGGIGQPVPLPSGSTGPSTPRPSRPAATFRDDPTVPGGGTTPGGTLTGNGIGPFIAIAVILAIGIGALVFAAYRRTPNKPMHPDQAWGSVARLASRIGLGPRPSQTVFEFAGALADEVPTARLELTTIARAKVEVAYGRQALETDRLKRIAQAYHRLRFALLSLVIQRGFRRRRRKPGKP